MNMLRLWHALLYLGDGAVLMPCSLLLFIWWIASPATRRTGWLWLGAVLLAGGVVALSKLLYMLSGWRPAGWNFIGLSGHAALSFLFWPALSALITGPNRKRLAALAIALGAALALAISAASWLLREHSLSEIVLGAAWGAAAAAAFLVLTWQHLVQRPLLRNWMVVSLLLLGVVAYKHEFPSAHVLGRIATYVGDQKTIHTRDDLGPHAQLSTNATATDRRHFRARPPTRPPALPRRTQPKDQ